MRLLPYEDLRRKKGIPYCRDHTRRLSKIGRFPKPVQLSNRRIAYVEEEIDAWIAAKLAARDDLDPAALEVEPRSGPGLPVAAEKPVQLSNRRIAYVEEEIDASVAAKLAARDGCASE
jgi:prophage regulatory protein